MLLFMIIIYNKYNYYYNKYITNTIIIYYNILPN